MIEFCEPRPGRLCIVHCEPDWRDPDGGGGAESSFRDDCAQSAD